MSNFSFKDSIITPVVSWIEQDFEDIPILVLRQNVERPDEDYFGLQFITHLMKNGSRDDIIHKENTIYSICGQRSFVLSISAYLVKTSKNRDIHDDIFLPHDRLKILQDSVENPAKMEVLRNAGLAVWDAGDILDIPEEVETGFESRAQMDITMGIASNRDVDLGRIDKVKFTGTMNGVTEPEITVNED